MKNFYKLIILVFFTKTYVTLGMSANVNQVSHEFDDNIENKKDLDQKIDMYRRDSISLVNNETMREIFDPKRDNKLEELEPDSIEVLGREKRNMKENLYFNDFETDFTKPGSSQYKIDMKKIAERTEKTLKGLTKILRDSGIECDEAKNSKDEIIDPYFIETKLEKNKETKYIEHFCEQPRNTYHCQDVLNIRCLVKGWTDHPWQEPPRELLFSWQDIMERNWFYREKWKIKRAYNIRKRKRKPDRFGVHMKNSPGIREEIAKRLGIHIGHIHPNLDVIARGNGKPFHINKNDAVWATYNVKYKYRDGHEICTKWSEERWDEICNISSK